MRPIRPLAARRRALLLCALTAGCAGLIQPRGDAVALTRVEALAAGTKGLSAPIDLGEPAAARGPQRATLEAHAKAARARTIRRSPPGGGRHANAGAGFISDYLRHLRAPRARDALFHERLPLDRFRR